MADQETKHLRYAALDYNWDECQRLSSMLFNVIGFSTAFAIGVKQLKRYLSIFNQKEPEISWVNQLIDIWERKEIIETSSLVRYEDVTDWGNVAYLRAVELFDDALSENSKSKNEKALHLLAEGLLVFTRAMRYEFWSTAQPQLVSFWNAAEELNGRLASLSYARDPIVNDYVKDIWFSLADDIDSALEVPRRV